MIKNPHPFAKLFTLLLWGAGVKSFLIIMCAFFAQLSVASVPEPSFVIYGQVQSSGNQVTQDGLVVSARYGGNHLSEATLSQSNGHEFVLEIPLEANIGNRDIYKARVGDVLSLDIAGSVVANLQISDRGITVNQNLELPTNFDSDGDGINDALEIADGRDPNDPNDPVAFGNLDLDGDGISNGA